MDIKALVAKAKQDLDTVEHVDQDVMIGDAKTTIRLWPLSGIAWRDLCALHPNRTNSEFDEALGYNLTAVTQSYPRVYAVDGDDVTDLAEDWPDVCAVLSGPDLKALEYAIWGINEYDPTQRLAAAGKASAGSRKKKRS
jgi:hypothetical protein